MTLYEGGKAVVLNLPPSFNIEHELRSAKIIRLATAFAHMTGWNMLSDSICQSKATKYFLAGCSFFRTEPTVLSCWLKLPKELNANARLYPAKDTTFHPKVLIVDGESPFAIVGSGNLSRGGLKDNIECGLYTDDEYVVGELGRWFDDLFNHAPVLTEKAIIDYKKKWTKFRPTAEKFRKELEAAEREFHENREAELKHWDAAVATAKSYLSSERYTKTYKARLDAAKLIKKSLRYPNCDFDATGWKLFYGVLEMGRLIPIWRERIFRKKKRLQTGLRGLISGPPQTILNELLLPKGRYHIQGLGLNALSKVLAVHDPTKWTVYNTPVEKTLRKFGYVPSRGGTPAEKYVAFTDMMNKFKAATGAEDAFALDSFFMDYYFHHLKKSLAHSEDAKPN